jgi:hypothetical protein
MEQATTIGLDIAKHVFQVHGADGAGHVVERQSGWEGALPRQKCSPTLSCCLI